MVSAVAGVLAQPAPLRGKRLFDVAASLCLLLVLSPLLLAIALALRCSGVPFARVFLSHERVGRGGAPFGCLKFRTMREMGEDEFRAWLADNPDQAEEWERTRKLSRDPRVTVLGGFLRRSSLDELPQLLNVLRGDMSMVGPRPVTRAELANYGAGLALVLSVRPGLTGLWQVSGRSDVGWGERAALDARYASDQGWEQEIRILLATPGAVLGGKGAR